MEIIAGIPDLQCPQQDDKAIEVAIKLIKHIKPTIAIMGGDVIAADSVGDYPKTTWKEASETLRNEAEQTNKVLDKFDRAFKDSKTKQIYYLEGNHERRVLKWAIKNTKPLGEIEGLRIESLLRLNERGYKYIMLEDQPLKFPRFNFLHGYYVNQYHAAKTMNMTGRNTFYFHTHDHQVHTSYHFEEDTPRMAMSCGCLCSFNQDYMKGRPNNWMHGIAVIYYDKDGFTPYFIPIVNYRAIWQGKVFK